MPPLKRGSGSYAGDTISGERIQAIRQLTLQGYSANAIGDIIRSQGMSISRQALQAVVRETTSATEKAPGIQRTAGPFQVSESLYQDTTRLRPNERIVHLQTTFDYFGFDQPRPFGVSLRFSGPITKNRLLNMAISQLSAAMATYGRSISEDDLLFTEAYRGVESQF